MQLKKTKFALAIVIILLVITRALAPWVIEERINRAIAANPEVSGGVEDVDLWLLSGRVAVDELVINKAVGDIPEPILDVRALAFSISWQNLFRGELFGDIELDSPILNIVDAKREEDTQTGQEIDWRRALTAFYPFEISQIRINDGRVHLQNFQSNPPVDIYIDNIEVLAKNITNQVEIEDSRAATIELNATPMGSGKISANASFNLLRQPSKASLELRVSSFELATVNDFARAYGNLDIQQGELDLQTHINMSELQGTWGIDGFAAPTLTRLNVLRWQKDAQVDNDPGIILAWEGLVDAVTMLLEVGPKDKMETRIPIQGTLNDPEVGVVTGVWGLVKNAFQGAFGLGDDD